MEDWIDAHASETIKLDATLEITLRRYKRMISYVQVAIKYGEIDKAEGDEILLSIRHHIKTFKRTYPKTVLKLKEELGKSPPESQLSPGTSDSSSPGEAAEPVGSPRGEEAAKAMEVEEKDLVVDETQELLQMILESRDDMSRFERMFNLYDKLSRESKHVFSKKLREKVRIEGKLTSVPTAMKSPEEPPAKRRRLDGEND